MNILTQKAKKKQGVVEYAKKNGQSKASRKYGVSLSSVKRWCNLYDGTWQSLVEKSHRPHSNPSRHTKSEERKIKKAFRKAAKTLRLEQRESPRLETRTGIMGL